MFLERLSRTFRLEWSTLWQNSVSDWFSLPWWVLNFVINAPLKSINFLNLSFSTHFMVSSMSGSQSSSSGFCFARKAQITGKVPSKSNTVSVSLRIMQQGLHRHTFLANGHFQLSYFCTMSTMLSLQMISRQSTQYLLSHVVAAYSLQHWYTNLPLFLHMWQYPIFIKLNPMALGCLGCVFFLSVASSACF